MRHRAARQRFVNNAQRLDTTRNSVGCDCIANHISLARARRIVWRQVSSPSARLRVCIANHITVARARRGVWRQLSSPSAGLRVISEITSERDPQSAFRCVAASQYSARYRSACSNTRLEAARHARNRLDNVKRASRLAALVTRRSRHIPFEVTTNKNTTLQYDATLSADCRKHRAMRKRFVNRAQSGARARNDPWRG